MWDRLTRPLVPSSVDPNLEEQWEEEDDDALLPPSLPPLAQLESIADRGLEGLTDDEGGNDEE